MAGNTDSRTPADDMPYFGPMLARAYASHWLEHSTSLVRYYPEIARRFGISGGCLADVACGEGTFALAMARRHWRVWGVDRSSDMLALAEAKAKRSRLSVVWLRQDMRELRLPEPVDLITCWYNSLNYLLCEEDLAKTLCAMADALLPGGWLLFDVYTLHGLAMEWANRAWVAVDADDCFVASQTHYEPRTRRAEVTFTGFLRVRNRYVRFDEHHHHQGYPWPVLRRLLVDAGFHTRGRFIIPTMAKPDRWSKRIYVAAQKRKGS